MIPRILKTTRSLLQALLDLLERLGQCAADGALVRGGSFRSMAADLTDEERLVRHGCRLSQVGQGGLKESVMGLLNLVGQVETAPRVFLAISLCLFYEAGIHLGEFMMLTADGCRQVVFCGLDALQHPEVVAGVDRLGLGRSAEEAGDLLLSLLLGLLG